MFIKRFKIYFQYYLKKIVYSLLSSSFFCKNKVYSSILRSHFLKRTGKHKDPLHNLVYPQVIEIEPTNICNQECVFCPNPGHNRQRGVMSFDIFKKIAGQIDKLRVNQVIIGGLGEPLVDKELIAKLTYLRNNTSARIELVTNGILLTKELSETICKEKLLDSLDISIDSADAQTYNRLHKFKEFDLIVSNLRYLAKIKKDSNFSLPFVCARFKDFYLNKGSFRSFVNVFLDLSDRIRAYMNIFRWPYSKVPVKSVGKSKLIRFPCPNLQEGIRVNWNGNLILCCMDYEDRVVLGNVRDEPIIDIYNNDLINSYRKKHREFQFSNLTVCDQCDVNSHLVIPW